MNLSKKRITVTGRKGFLGTHLVRKLRKEKGCKNVFIADLPEYDLRILKNIKNMYDNQKSDIVIHLAAEVGRIGANRENPGKFFYDNAIMEIQLVHEGYLRGIEKFVDAIENKDQHIDVWGTGKASRECLYVEDAAEAIILATEKYNKPDPVNIGTGFEIKIKYLVQLITKLTEFNGKIIWDTSKPDGQP